MTSPHRLVVIGNGMAGARLVEDVLARASGDRFEVSMFGDEPYGNYNRILLSGVLAGTQQPDDIFINPLAWYTDNEVDAARGRRRGTHRSRRAQRGPRRATGGPNPTTRWSSPPAAVPFVPPIENLAPTDPSHGPRSGPASPYKDGVFVFRTLDDCERMLARAADVKSAAVIGGGLLGLEAARGLLDRGLEVNVVHLMEHLMETQLDRDAGPDAARQSMEQLGRQGAPRQVDDRRARRRLASPACSSRTARRSTATCSSSPPASGRTWRSPRPAAWPSSAASSSTTTWRPRDADDLRGRRVRRAPRHGLWAGGTAVGADGGAGRPAHRPRPRTRSTRARGRRTKLKVMGVDLAVMGEKQSRDADDEVVTYAEPGRGVYKKLIVRDGKLAGAILLGDTSAAPALQQLFDRSDAAPRLARLAALPDRRRTGPAVRRRPAGRRPDLQLQRRLEGPRSSARCAAAARPSRRSATPPGPVPAAARARPRSRRSSRRWPATRCRTIRRRTTTCPACRCPSATLIAAIRSMNLRSVSQVFDVLAAGQEDPGSKAGLASLLKTIWGNDVVDERDARFINDRVHANIQKRRHLQRRAAHLRRRHQRRRPAQDRRRRRQVQRAAW